MSHTGISTEDQNVVSKMCKNMTEGFLISIDIDVDIHHVYISDGMQDVRILILNFLLF